MEIRDKIAEIIIEAKNDAFNYSKPAIKDVIWADQILTILPFLDEWEVVKEWDKNISSGNPYNLEGIPVTSSRPLTWEDVPHLLNYFQGFIDEINKECDGKVVMRLPDGGRVRKKSPTDRL